MAYNDNVSVIIPVYNAKEYLERCMMSVINQTYNELEILTVDDGSSDFSAAMNDEYASKDTRIVSIHKKNGGVDNARNNAVDLSNGRYIAFVDADDYILPNMYEEMVNCKKNTNCDIIVCQWQWEDKNGEWTVDHNDINPEIYGEKNGIEFERFLYQGGYCDGVACSPWNKLYPAKIIKSERFYGRKFQDYRINDKIASQGYTYYVMKQFYYMYCESIESITRGQKFSEIEYLFLDILKTRRDLFHNDDTISIETMKRFCTIYVEDCIYATYNHVPMPSAFHRIYLEYCKEITSAVSLKAKIRFFAFAVFPKLLSWFYTLRMRKCQH